MKISLYQKYGAQNSTDVWPALATALEHRGHTVTYNDPSADVAVIWSQLWSGKMKPNHSVWKEYRNSGRTVIVVEVGMIQRGYTWKIGINGDYSPVYTGQENDRQQSLGVELYPWQTSGDHIVIACQRSDSQLWKNRPDTEHWVHNVCTQLREYTDRPIEIRSHPRQPVLHPHAVKPNKLSGTYDSYDFKNCLANAWAVINVNSNPGVESIINGIPGFVCTSSLAYPVGNDIDFLHDIENPLRPDRQQWVQDLCYTEWTVNEIKTGLPFEYLRTSEFLI